MTNQIAELKTLIEQKQAELEELEYEFNNYRATLSTSDYEDQYEEMLDEIYGECHGFDYSRVLKNLDPIAFRIGLNEYVDNIDLYSIEEYKELEEKIDDLTFEIENLEIDLEELEEEETNRLIHSFT